MLRFAVATVAVFLVCSFPAGAQSTVAQSPPSEVVGIPSQKPSDDQSAVVPISTNTKAAPEVTSFPWVRVTLVPVLLLGLLGSLSLGWNWTRELALAWKGASPRSRGIILAKGIGGVVLWVLIACRAFNIAGYEGLVAIDLERSWQHALEYVVAHGYRFGDQIIYTYGPLGFLTTHAGLGGFATERVLYGWAHATLAAYLAFRVGLLLPKPLRYLPWLWLFLSPATDIMTVALAGVVLMTPRPAGTVASWLEIPGLAAYGAIMLSCKFTNVVAWSGMMGAVALYFLLCGQWKSALVRVVPFALLGIAVWLFSGQTLSNLQAYISNALKISKAYDTMSIPALTGMLIGGAVSASVLMLMSLAGLWMSPRPQKLKNLVKVLMILGCAFLSWKHGFVRADAGHAFLFLWMAVPYAILLLWACPLPPWLVSLTCSPPSGDGGEVRLFRARVSTTALSLIAAFSCVPLFMYAEEVALSLRFTFSAHRNALHKALSSLSPGFRLPGIAELTPRMRAEADLPVISKMVGTETVDLVTNTQVWALANPMNYAPRPVFQGYAAGSLELQKMNLAHYLSPATKPRYAILHLGPIDYRYAWLEDSPLLLHLATRWKPIREERGFVLLEEDPNAKAGTWTRIKSSKSAVWGKWVKFTSEPNRLLSLRVETFRTGYGRLKRFLYQGAQCEITLRLDTGEEVTRTFAPELAAEGFLVNPYFPAAPHFGAWRTDPTFISPNVVAFKIAPVAGSDAEFEPKFRYKLSAYQYVMKAEGRIPPPANTAP